MVKENFQKGFAKAKIFASPNKNH